MNQLSPPGLSTKESVDFASLITVTCHLMTLYALKPCEPLATNINRHIKAILNSSASDSLGEWTSTFTQLLPMWELIAEQHIRKSNPKSQQQNTHYI